MKTPQEKLKEYAINPTQAKRDFEDICDTAGDIYHDRGMREVLPREIKKAVKRTYQDAKKNWGSL